MISSGPQLRERFARGERLLGTFVKTPAPQVVEVLGRSGIGFAVLDAEHAPFDRGHIDLCVMAGRASGLELLVRIPDASVESIQNALDIGAAGVVVPRVTEPETIRSVRQAASYSGAGRGYSNSPRAGDYGSIGMREMLEQGNRRATIICQIEHAHAVDHIDLLAAADEADGFLIGPADLAVSYGAQSTSDPQVAQAIARVSAACQAAGKPIGIAVPDAGEALRYAEQGMSFFVVGSDQLAVLQHFRGLVRAIADAKAA